MPTMLVSWWRRQGARYHHRRGLTAYRKRAFEEAMDAFDRALLDHADPAQVWVNRGLACWQRGNAEAAIANFDRAIALNPSQADAYKYRGQVREDLGDEAGALSDWALACHYRPTDAEVYHSRARVYLRQGQAEWALDDLNRTLDCDPNRVAAYYERGTLLDRLGDRPGAVRDWKLAVCNDLSFNPAKNKLLTLRQERHDRSLSTGLHRALLESGLVSELALEAQDRGTRIDVEIYRPLGSTVNYRALVDRIREYLIPLQLNHIRQFRLIGRVADQRFPEWSQIYPLYDDQSCPPSRWRMALFSLLMCPPLGVAATFFAAEVKAAYDRGEPQVALRASNAVKGLWALSRGLLGVLLVAIVFYGGFLALTPARFKIEGQPRNSFQERLRRNTTEGRDGS